MSEVIELLAKLVAIDSVNPDLVPGGVGEAKVAAFVETWFSARGFAIERLEPKPGRPSIVATAKGSGGGRSLMFNGHLDVVGVTGYVGDPFEPRIEGGRLYGRGSIDMKAGVAAMMVAAARAKAKGCKGEILVACVADEEFGSLGSTAVAEKYRPDAVIVTEPTDMVPVVTHKGYATFDIHIEGKAAHGSRPDLGIDAIAKAGHFLVALEAYGKRLAQGQGVPLLGPGSVHASMIWGGQEMSSYPAACTVQLERRTVPGETAGTVEQDLHKILADLTVNVPDFRASLVRQLCRDPLVNTKDTPIILALEKAASAHHGRPTKRSGIAFWTDAALFSDKGIPALVFGPIGEGLHSKTEWADIASVEACAGILEATALAFCNG